MMIFLLDAEPVSAGCVGLVLIIALSSEDGTPTSNRIQNNNWRKIINALFYVYYLFLYISKIPKWV
jgi:hypothetical protein